MNTSKLHVLVGIDFSESSNIALFHAARIARRISAQLHLCHVVYGDGFIADTDLGLDMPAEFPEAEDARGRMQRLLHMTDSMADGQLHVRMNMSPVDGMMCLIKELKPDLVVVGSHGKGGLKRALLGSVSDELAQRSPVPVVVIPAPGREALLNRPTQPPEPELPAVGRDVASRDNGCTGYGIAGIGGGEVVLR